MIKDLATAYGEVFEPELLERINEVGIYKEIPAGTKLIEIGDYVRSIPLLLTGVVKILREDEDGDELLLYFLESGDTCAATLSCCVGQTKSEIRAITEKDSALIMIPIEKMETMLSKYKSWRSYVLQSYQNRFDEMLETIDSIAFLNMDERLLKYLKDKKRVTNDNIINNTHQEIAYELHTSRVVVSRLLKKLEKMGKIKLNRNHIEIIAL